MDFTYRPLTLSDLTFSETTNAALKQDPTLARKLAGIARDLHQLRIDTREKQAELLDFYADRDAGYKLAAADWLKASRAALEDKSTPAGVLLVAARNVLGPGMAAWEPDTLHVELEDREKLSVPSVNFDKLFAAITLTEVPAFYWEANTFSNTVQAFNHEGVDADILHEATPAQLCWAVYEAELVLHENALWQPDFDYEPTLYIAEVLHRNGMVMAPPLLAFAQDALTERTEEGPDLEKVREAWNKLDKSALSSRTFSEDSVDVQLARLAACQLYVDDHADKYAAALRRLSDEKK